MLLVKFYLLQPLVTGGTQQSLYKPMFLGRDINDRQRFASTFSAKRLKLKCLQPRRFRCYRLEIKYRKLKQLSFKRTA
jgi:hypothetical protein